MEYLLTFLSGATTVLIFVAVSYTVAKVAENGDISDLTLVMFLGGLLAVMVKVV